MVRLILVDNITATVSFTQEIKFMLEPITLHHMLPLRMLKRKF